MRNGCVELVDYCLIRVVGLGPFKSFNAEELLLKIFINENQKIWFAV